MKGPGKTAREKKGDVLIRNLYPEIAGGRYPVKRETDRPLAVSADIPGVPPGRVRLIYRMINPEESPW